MLVMTFQSYFFHTSPSPIKWNANTCGFSIFYNVNLLQSVEGAGEVCTSCGHGNCRLGMGNLEQKVVDDKLHKRGTERGEQQGEWSTLELGIKK
jgi:hypothetical protein